MTTTTADQEKELLLYYKSADAIRDFNKRVQAAREQDSIEVDEKDIKNAFATMEKLLAHVESRGEGILGLAKELENLYAFAAMEDNGDLYVYDKPLDYYVLKGEVVIKKELQKYCPTISDTTVKQVIEKIRQRKFTDRKLFDADPDWLHVGNGWVNVNTKEFQGPSHALLSFGKIPHNYDPEATNPEQQKFFEQVCELEDLDTVQKFFGYILLHDQRFKKAFSLVGPKDTGKSKFLELVEYFAGLVSHVSLHDMAEFNHNVAEITKSIVNTTSELPKYRLKDVSLFKAYTGGDERTFREIYGRPFQTRPRSKFLMAANELPNFDGMDKTFIERWIVLRFSNVFKQGDDMDPDIIKKITTPAEMSGLLNYAIDGLTKLLRDGYFKDEDYETLKTKWESITSKLIEYRDQYLETDAQSYVIGTELFAHYESTKPDKPLSLAIFGREIKKLGIANTQKRINGQVRRIYTGIKIKGVTGVTGNFSINDFGDADK